MEKKYLNLKEMELSIEEWLRYGSQESLSLFMYKNPKRAKKLYKEIIPKTTDEYFSHLKKYEQTIDQYIENPVWHLHQGNPPKPDVWYTLLLNLPPAWTQRIMI